MTATATREPATQTLEVPGATLVYDIRRSDNTSEPPLLLIGSPMAAPGFTTLASHFADRTVVTYDPRGSERSKPHDPTAPITPEVQADDVHAVIEAIGGGPVDIFASSGGAVVTLALIAKYPNDLRTAVAHEPPLASVVPDREHALAANKAIYDAYNAEGFGMGMAKFMQVVMHQGPFTADTLAGPLDGLQPVDLGVDAGQRLGIPRAERLAAGHRRDALQGRHVGVVATAGDVQRNAEGV